jgi:HEAT repeat protein
MQRLAGLDVSRALVLIAFYTLCAAVVSTASAQESESDGLVELVIGLLHEQDSDVRALAFEQVRTEAPGEAATKRFAAELSKLGSEAQVGLLRALAGRGDNVAREAVLPLLDSSDVQVKIAAIEALGPLGMSADVAKIASLLADGSDMIKASARRSLEQLSGKEASETMIEVMRAAEPNVRVPLIEVLAVRRAAEGCAALLQAAMDKDAKVRKAAMVALGELGSEAEVPGMVKAILQAPRGAERAAAERALLFVCQRGSDPSKPAAPVIAAIKSLSPADRLAMLSALGRIGGDDARQIVEQAIASKKGDEHSAGIAALANWPTADIAPRLIELVKSEKHDNHRTTMLRALIRIAPLPDDRDDAERLALLKQAMTMCQRDADRSYVLQRAAAIRIPETLEFVLPYTKDPKFAETACLAVVELAHHRTLRESKKEAFMAALDQVMSISQDATTVERARRYKNNETWVRPK